MQDRRPKVHTTELSLSEFEIYEVLGRGATSTVYRAKHKSTHQPVALKEIRGYSLMSQATREMLKREINLQRTLRHPNVLRLLSYFRDHETRSFVIVLELCQESLYDLLRRRNQMTNESVANRSDDSDDVQTTPSGSFDSDPFWPPPSSACSSRASSIPSTPTSPAAQPALSRGAFEAAPRWSSGASAAAPSRMGCVFPEHEVGGYLRDIGRGLQAVHHAGYVHRDLKLDNVLISHDGVLKLSDFGCVQELDVGRDTVCGTLDYLPPEVIGRRAHTAKADVWSLGVIAVELLTGAPPFFRESSSETLEAIQVGDPALPSMDLHGVSSSTVALLHAMLEKSPSARPTLHEVLQSPLCSTHF